jgi:site-specific DNA recombinase
MKSEFTNGAVGYVRISMKDQSAYSISYQKTAIADYCVHNKLNLLALFTDDGESSYTFDRPNWIAMEAFISRQKGKVKYLIVLDHDRFSRNLSKALAKID